MGDFACAAVCDVGELRPQHKFRVTVDLDRESCAINQTRYPELVLGS